MLFRSYDFFTTWRVTGTCEEVHEVLSDGDSLVRWWPSVYLQVKTTKPGDDRGVGKVMDLYTKGWLPYTLRWDFEIVETDPPHGFTLKAHGDFEGTGVWSFRQDGDTVEMTYDWRIDAEKPLLKALSPVLKPIFAANHRWAMARGQESLELELRRRHARTAAEREAVPPPPPPTFR